MIYGCDFFLGFVKDKIVLLFIEDFNAIGFISCSGKVYVVRFRRIIEYCFFSCVS